MKDSETVKADSTDKPVKCCICRERPEEVLNPALGYAFICGGRGSSGTHYFETFFNLKRSAALAAWKNLNSGEGVK